MQERMAQAQREGFGPNHAGFKEFVLARAATNDATMLGGKGEGLGSAALLLRSAVMLLVRARLSRLGIEPSRDAAGDACWAQLLEQPTMAETAAELSPNQRKLFATVLAVRGHEYVAQLSEEQFQFLARSLLELAQQLAAPFVVESRRVPAVRIVRWTRISIAAAVVVSIVGFAWSKITYRPNLALHKTVTVETMYAPWSKDPGLLVDGDRMETAFHTIEAPNQHVTIDLGAPHRLSRVVVYNRTDCCQERAVPLRVDVSIDGKDFKEVARRNEVFPESWTANFAPTKARYVRLVNLSKTYFHLSEVEVY